MDDLCSKELVQMPPPSASEDMLLLIQNMTLCQGLPELVATTPWLRVPCNRGIVFYHFWVMEHLYSEVGSGPKTIASKFPLLLACAKFLPLLNKFRLITFGAQGIYLSYIGVSCGGTPLLLSSSETMER